MKIDAAFSTRGGEQDTGGEPVRLPRRKLKWSEILAAPVHDFPIRDEILHQFVPKLPGLKLLEVGPGSGFTAYTLCISVEQLTLVDCAEGTVSDLQEKLGLSGNVRLMRFDICQPGMAAHLGETYDLVFGLDMFEYVSNELQGMKNLADVTRSGGVMFLTFPNFIPPRGDGVTWYVHRLELQKSLSRAGFRRWEILCVSLKPYARAVFTVMHEWPLRLYRRLRKKNAVTPQTYESTWAFQNRRRLQRSKPLLLCYWALLKFILRLGGELFQAKAAPENLLSRQLVVLAWK